MSSKYERLPNICYWCGWKGRIPYHWKIKNDSWIRAAPVSMPRKSVVRVPRFYAAKKKSQKVGEHQGDENLRPATRMNPVTSAPHNQPHDMDTMDFTDEIEVNQIKKEPTIKSLNFSQFGSR